MMKTIKKVYLRDNEKIPDDLVLENIVHKEITRYLDTDFLCIWYYVEM